MTFQNKHNASLSNIYKDGARQTVLCILFFVIVFQSFQKKSDVLSQALYVVKLKGNGPVNMTTTKATKHVISSHKLYQARQNRQIFKRMSFKLVACLRHIRTSLYVHLCLGP